MGWMGKEEEFRRRGCSFRRPLSSLIVSRTLETSDSVLVDNYLRKFGAITVPDGIRLWLVEECFADSFEVMVASLLAGSFAFLLFFVAGCLRVAFLYTNTSETSCSCL